MGKTDTGPQPCEGLEVIFDLMLEREGFDLRLYRRSTIERRITTRSRKLLCANYSDYAKCLREDANECRHLIEHITIKVSRFYRDADVFNRLHNEVLPEIVTRKSKKGEVTIWSAGSGYGEEGYTIAILLEDMRARGLQIPKVNILGTDVDSNALDYARKGIYPEAALVELPLEFKQTYFTVHKGRHGPVYEVVERLRKEVTFQGLDLLLTDEIDDNREFDLVLCRNVLIYFERTAQDRVYDLLTRSVAPLGYLCLGEAEQLPGQYLTNFQTIDRKARLYRKKESRPKGVEANGA